MPYAFAAKMKNTEILIELLNSGRGDKQNEKQIQDITK